MARLEELVRGHRNGVMVSGFTVHETAMSDCVFPLGGTEPCIRQDYPSAFRLTLQLEGPYALPPDRVRNSVDLTFLTEEEFFCRVAEGDFLEHAGVHGKHYGPSRAFVNRIKGTAIAALNG